MTSFKFLHLLSHYKIHQPCLTCWAWRLGTTVRIIMSIPRWSSRQKVSKVACCNDLLSVWILLWFLTLPSKLCKVNSLNAQYVTVKLFVSHVRDKFFLILLHAVHTLLVFGVYWWTHKYSFHLEIYRYVHKCQTYWLRGLVTWSKASAWHMLN